MSSTNDYRLHDLSVHGFTIQRYVIIRKRSRRLGFILALDLHPLEKLVRRDVAESATMFKDDELAGGHQPAGRRTVVLEHTDQSIPKQIQIIFAKTSLSG